jgi:hypothetical protein
MIQQPASTMTERLTKALALIEVRVKDHFIVGASVVSFAERGLIYRAAVRRQNQHALLHARFAAVERCRRTCSAEAFRTNIRDTNAKSRTTLPRIESESIAAFAEAGARGLISGPSGLGSARLPEDEYAHLMRIGGFQ